jgi:hypothetical protein
MNAIDMDDAIRSLLTDIGGDERVSLASTTDFDVNVLVTALSKLASATPAQISR